MEKSFLLNFFDCKDADRLNFGGIGEMVRWNTDAADGAD